jgi:hypothetical protein
VALVLVDALLIWLDFMALRPRDLVGDRSRATGR